MALLLDGKRVRDERTETLKERVASCAHIPRLVILQVGDRPDSNAYIAQKKKFGEALGVEVDLQRFAPDANAQELRAAIMAANIRSDVSGVIVQLPLPDHLDTFNLIEAIDPKKDVDGLTAVNVKRLAGGEPGIVPATARGVETLLDYYRIPLEGQTAAVVGRSMLVGTPVARVLQKRGVTVTVCHSKTKDLARHTTNADILVVAAGSPRLITAEHVSADQIVVDVGINLNTGESFDEELPGGKFVGDVLFEEVKSLVTAISPVPGGVGPMTVLSLFENLVDAHEKLAGK